MPRRLDIDPKDKRDLFRRYARGETPSDLVRSRRDLKLSVRQVANLVSREGWAQRKAEIAEERRKSADEALETVRQDSIRELEPVLRDVAAGLKIDAERLRDGWELVEDAAGASSLQRAKGLHLNRLLKFHGLERPNAATASVGLAFMFNRVGRLSESAGAIDVTGQASGPAEAEEPLNLEFDENDE